MDGRPLRSVRRIQALLLFLLIRCVSGHRVREAPNHPPLFESGTEGLPKGCISYADRFGRYMTPDMMQAMFDPNDLYPEATSVLVIKLHYGVTWSKDLVIFLISTAHELSAAGMHMYLLVQDSVHQPAQSDDTPEKFRRSLPIPLRPMLFLFDEEDVHNTYRKLHEYHEHVRDYLPFVYFLHRFPGYEFAWYMEYDVRYTGPSLAVFLQSLLDIADQRLHARLASEPGNSVHLNRRHNRKLLQEDGKEEEEEEEEEIPAEAKPSEPVEARAEAEPEAGPESEELEEEEEPATLVPDFLFIGEDLGESTAITEDVHPRDYHPDRWNVTQYHHRLMMLMGWSRSYAQLVHARSQDGRGGFLEEYLPSLAASANMSTVGLKVDMYYGPSFHCCFGKDVAERFYQEYHQYKNKCFPYALLHPVKLETPYWENQLPLG